MIKQHAFVQQYATVSRLSFDKTGGAHQLKTAMQLPTAAESHYSSFDFREVDTAIRDKRAEGPDGIPPSFLKALGPMAKTE